MLESCEELLWMGLKTSSSAFFYIFIEAMRLVWRMPRLPQSVFTRRVSRAS